MKKKKSISKANSVFLKYAMKILSVMVSTYLVNNKETV